MSGRYWISGVQLGVMKALSQRWDTDNTLSELVETIEDGQFIGNIGPNLKVALVEKADDARVCPKCDGEMHKLRQSILGRRGFSVTERTVTTNICLTCGYAEVAITPRPGCGHEEKVKE